MSIAAVLGAVISIGRTGNPGVYGEFCVIGAITYTISLFVLQRRR
jgi:hypothetical protein